MEAVKHRIRLGYKHIPEVELPPVLYGPSAPPYAPIGGFDHPPHCTEMACLWPCSHHDHEWSIPGFKITYHSLTTFAAGGCVPCKHLQTLFGSTCCCRLKPVLRGQHSSHRCIEAEIWYYEHDQSSWRSTVTMSRVSWECGTCFVDICLQTGDIALQIAAKCFTFADVVGATTNLPLPPLSGEVYSDPRSPEVFSLHRKWLADCLDTHKDCPQTSIGQLPTRVINVLELLHLDIVRLEEPKARDARYIALSYCWGGKMPPCTTTATFERHCTGIRLIDLPQTYQDAVTVARSLGIPYVWIDALCIVQDSQKDRDHEISQMANIYANATLVVLAAASLDPAGGFLRRRHKHFWQHVESVASNEVLRCSIREFAKHDSVIAADNAVLGTRAWCYQERLLAPRRLIFDEWESVWECRTGCRCECSSNETGYQPALPRYNSRTYMLPRNYIPEATHARMLPALDIFPSTQHAYQFWRDSVERYTTRRLSRASDKLPAIAALATVVCAATGDEYLAGLWKGDLLHELMWKNARSWSKLSSGGEGGGRGNDIYIAPSFSWASRSGPITFQARGATTRLSSFYDCAVDLLDSRCIRSGGGQFGQVSGCSITVEGFYYDVEAELVPASPTTSGKVPVFLQFVRRISIPSQLLQKHQVESIMDNTLHVGIYVPGWGVALRPSFTGSQKPVVGKVRMFWLDQAICLVLTPSMKKPGTFERLGLMAGEPSPFFLDAYPNPIIDDTKRYGSQFASMDSTRVAFNVRHLQELGYSRMHGVLTLS